LSVEDIQPFCSRQVLGGWSIARKSGRRFFEEAMRKQKTTAALHVRLARAAVDISNAHYGLPSRICGFDSRCPLHLSREKSPPNNRWSAGSQCQAPDDAAH
jgi:hypothetical protein